MYEYLKAAANACQRYRKPDGLAQVRSRQSVRPLHVQAGEGLSRHASSERQGEGGARGVGGGGGGEGGSLHAAW